MAASYKSGCVVHVWIAKPSHQTCVNHSGYFSPDEQARADHLVDPSQREDLLRRRRFIHESIAAVWGLNSNKISVAHEPTGRPYLLHGQQLLTANLSISTGDDYLAFAASADCPVGIDIESILTPDDALNQRILSAHELADINSRDTADAAIALTAYWTRKEAYLKLHGLGLRVEPRKIEVLCSLPTGPGSGNSWCSIPLIRS